MKKTICFGLALCLCLWIARAWGEEAQDALPPTLYHNPDGGHYYHADANCRSVHKKYLPLALLDSRALQTGEPFIQLEPCPICMYTDATSAFTAASLPENVDDGGSATLSVNDQQAARAFAEAFFASPYVRESLEGRTLSVTQTGDGWKAEVVGGDAALTLLFDGNGRIAQYDNSAYTLPRLDSFALEGVPLATIHTLDRMRLALFPQVEYSQGSVYARNEETGAVYWALDDFSTWFVLQGEEQRIVGFGDLDVEARYSGYMIRSEAIRAAQEALAAKMPEDTALVQARFVVLDDNARGDNPLVPQWEVVFGENADGSGRQYRMVIDAATGDVPQTYDEAGNG